MRANNLILSSTFIAFINLTGGCTITETARTNSPTLYQEKISEVFLKTGASIKFDATGGRFIPIDSLVVGYSQCGQLVKIHINKVMSVDVERKNTAVTVLAVIGLIIVSWVILAVILLKILGFSVPLHR